MLLNDPDVRRGGARAGGARDCRKAGAIGGARLRFLFRAGGVADALGRRRLRLLQRSWRSGDWRTIEATPAAAAKADRGRGVQARWNVEAAELAAWTMVASTILNLDETITKE